MPTFDNSKTWSTEVLTSTDMNNHIKNNFDALVQPPVASWGGGNHTAAGAGYEDVDASTLSITLQEDGYIEIGCVGFFGGLSSGYQAVGISVNGTTYDCTQTFDIPNNSNCSFVYLLTGQVAGTYTIKLRQSGAAEVRYKNFWAKGVV